MKVGRPTSAGAGSSSSNSAQMSSMWNNNVALAQLANSFALQSGSSYVSPPNGSQVPTSVTSVPITQPQPHVFAPPISTDPSPLRKPLGTEQTSVLLQVGTGSGDAQDDETKITVVLDNMVPVAEASDPGLKDEIEEEVAQFGTVQKIDIEVVNNSFVRIKILYSKHVEAKRAYSALNGRYFGGNSIKATLT
jgi:hypothetical protein